MWRVARERILLAGGPAALLLQIAHPLIGEAVASHSGFRRDPLQRLLATLEATLAITFGDREQAEAAAGRVALVHRRVEGTIPDAVGLFPAGTTYRAFDPELAMWVHATLIATALDVYRWAVRPLPATDLERYYQEGKQFAFLFGVTEPVMPATHEDFLRYLEDMLHGPVLTVGPAAARLAQGVLDPPLVPVLRTARLPAPLVTASLLPDHLRRGYGLDWGRGRQAARSSLGATLRALIPALPPGVRFWPHYRTAMARSAG